MSHCAAYVQKKGVSHWERSPITSRRYAKVASRSVSQTYKPVAIRVTKGSADMSKDVNRMNKVEGGSSRWRESSLKTAAVLCAQLRNEILKFPFRT